MSSPNSSPVIHLRSVPLSRLPLPSLSVTLTSAPLDSSAPLELLNLTDRQHASSRDVHIDVQPKDGDPLMKTIDTRFAGSFAYTARYPINNSPKSKTTTHVRRATSSSRSCDDDDGVSTTSTTEADLNREFEVEAEADSNTELTSVIGDDDELSELGLEFEPPLPIPPPSSSIRRLRLPPLHRQPASLVSLTQIPPRHAFEVECLPGDQWIPMSVFAGVKSSRPPSPWGSANVSDALRALPRSSTSTRVSRAGCLKGVSGLLRALWRRVTAVGGVILHEFTKDL